MTDVILAAGPTVVALAALFRGAKQHKRAFEHERVMAGLMKVRALLDDAALVAHRTDYARYHTRGAILQHGSRIAVNSPEETKNCRTRASCWLRRARGSLSGWGRNTTPSRTRDVRLPSGRDALRRFDADADDGDDLAPVRRGR